MASLIPLGFIPYERTEIRCLCCNLKAVAAAAAAAATAAAAAAVKANLTFLGDKRVLRSYSSGSRYEQNFNKKF